MDQIGATVTIELLPAAACVERTWDVVVIGAGPAGTVAARQLAGRGHRVLLLERAALPREKICGDGLLVDSLGLLDRLGLGERITAAGRPLKVLAIYSPSGRKVTLACRALTLPRRTLDALLAREAADCGAVLARGEAVAAAYRDDGLLDVRCRDGSRLTAHYLLVASGADLALPRRLGLANPLPPSGAAMRRYLRSTLPLEELTIGFHRSVLPGYGWIFPLGDGFFNIGCGRLGQGGGFGDLRSAFAAFCRDFPPARELIARGESLTPLRGGILRTGLCGARTGDGRRILVTGEALGTSFPFTGEGIGTAMASSELVADCLHQALCAGDPKLLAAYRPRLEARLAPRQQSLQRAESWLGRPRLADLAVWLAQTSPALRRSLGDLLEGKPSQQESFGLPALGRYLITRGTRGTSRL